jgi:hypothetical protein
MGRAFRTAMDFSAAAAARKKAKEKKLSKTCPKPCAVCLRRKKKSKAGTRTSPAATSRSAIGSNTENEGRRFFTREAYSLGWKIAGKFNDAQLRPA